MKLESIHCFESHGGHLSETLVEDEDHQMVGGTKGSKFFGHLTMKDRVGAIYHGAEVESRPWVRLALVFKTERA